MKREKMSTFLLSGAMAVMMTMPAVAQSQDTSRAATALHELRAERQAAQGIAKGNATEQDAGDDERLTLRERIQSRRNAKSQKSSGETVTLGGREVSIWAPTATGPVPLVLFSHGFGGCPTQSKFLTQALADNGYLVIAPKHADANCGGGERGKPKESFREPSSWTDATYRDRRDDVTSVVEALRVDPGWKMRIDWDKVGLMGHSLGGYTVLGLGGGWASWRLSGVKAILALSPVCQPFVENGTLQSLTSPVSFQGGTRDIGITPGVKRPGGCYDKASAPAHFVEFQDAGHFAWTDRQTSSSDNIVFYAQSFFDSSLRGLTPASLHEKRAGVSELRWK